MNIKIKSLALVALAAFAASTSLTAQSVGYVTRTMTANTANVFSVPFNQAPSTFTGLTAGTLEAVSATSLTDNDAAWATNFATTASPYFIKITSGTAEGLYFQVGTTTTPTVANLAAGEKNPVTEGVVIGDSYEVIVGNTLRSFFSLLAVNSGTSAAVADQVFLINNGAWVGPHFLRSTDSTWRRGAILADNSVIRPETGVYYFRFNANGNLVIPVAGVVPDENQLYKLPNATSNIVNTVFPVDTTILSSGIQLTPGWTNNTDVVFILSNGAWTRLTWNGTSWRNGAIPANNTAILAGQPVFIQKNSGTPGTTSAYTRSTPY